MDLPQANIFALRRAEEKTEY